MGSLLTPHNTLSEFFPLFSRPLACVVSGAAHESTLSTPASQSFFNYRRLAMLTCAHCRTIPYFECTESANQCSNNCGSSNSACVTNCRTAHPCGAQDPVRVNTTAASTMSATASSTGGTAAETSGGSSLYTGFGSSPTSSSKPGSSNNAQALAVGFGRVYGLAIVLTSVFGGFTLLL